MKALVCERFGPIQDLQYKDFPDPEPKADEVLIANKAVSVNFPDGLVVQGLYQGNPPFPFFPGFESAGVVEAVGSEVQDLKVGDRVMAFNPEIGTYAEKIAIKASRVAKVPDEMSDIHAATMFCATSTAHHALKQRARLQPGETLVVLGAAGGTGLAAVQIGKAMGAEVIAVCSSDEKLAVAAASGADHLVNYANSDLRSALKEITGGKGVDVVYDPVGGKASESCSKCMAWNGRLLIVGFASGDMPKLPVNMALVKGFSIVGVFWGSFTEHEPEANKENIRELMEWYKAGLVRPVIEAVMPITEAVKALELVASRQVKGKIVLTV